MLNKETVNKFITWANVVGIFSIVTGAISALAGIFAFIIGAIPGVIMIIMGVKLLNAKKTAQELLYMEDESQAVSIFDRLMTDVTTYFKIQGILYIVSIVMSILAIILSFAMMIPFFNSMSSF